MTEKQRKILVAIFLIAVVLMIVFISNNHKNNKKEIVNNIENQNIIIQDPSGNKINTSEKLQKPRTELGYYISNVNLQKQGNKTIFKLNLINQSGEGKSAQLVDIVFLGKEGQEIYRLALYIREIKAGEFITTQATVDGDFTNVYDFKLQTR